MLLDPSLIAAHAGIYIYTFFLYTRVPSPLLGTSSLSANPLGSPIGDNSLRQVDSHRGLETPVWIQKFIRLCPKSS